MKKIVNPDINCQWIAIEPPPTAHAKHFILELVEAEHRPFSNSVDLLPIYAIWEFFCNGPLIPEIHTDMKNDD